MPPPSLSGPASTRFSWHVFCSKNLIFFSKVKTEEYKVCWWDFSPHITGLSQLALIPDTLSGWNSHGAGVSTTVSLLKFHLMPGLVTDATVLNALPQSMIAHLNLTPPWRDWTAPASDTTFTDQCWKKKLSQWPDLDTACFSYKTKVKQPSSFTFLTSACVSACDSRQQELMVYLMTLHE